VKISHTTYNVVIDFNNIGFISMVLELAKQYGRIPNTKCLQCPGHEIVVATCCKVYNPAMYFIEFLNILRNIEKNWTKQQKNDLFIKCLRSFLNPNIEKGCPLLEDTKCPIYEQRPFACRSYCQYSNASWEERMNKVSKTLNISINKLPMEGKQCRNVQVFSNNVSLSKFEEDDIFLKISELDVKVFPDSKTGKEFVYSTMTYLPFDTHYLLFRIGSDQLEVLTSMRLILEKNKEEVKNAKDDEKEGKIKKYEIVQSNINKFIEDNILKEINKEEKK